MDAQGRNKALFRAKLNAQKKEKRIDSPLISYNESDQPVCRVCDVVLKSVSHWDAHQASRKHHEVMSVSLYDPQNLDKNSLPKAINTLKANAARRTQASNTQSGLPPRFFDNHGTEKQTTEIEKLPDPSSNKKPGISAQTYAKECLYSETEEDGCPQSSAIQTKMTQPPESRQVTQLETKKVKGSLPDNFFDRDETKLPTNLMKPPRENKLAVKQASASETKTKHVKGSLPDDFFDKDDAKLPMNAMKPPRENIQASEQASAPETKQVKGALPEGFFDNKEADLRARGIKPVKIDVK